LLTSLVDIKFFSVFAWQNVLIFYLASTLYSDIVCGSDDSIVFSIVVKFFVYLFLC